MGKIYETQDWLRISLTYTADVASSISSVKIKYRKPDGTTGEFDATHDAANKKVYYDIPKGSPLGDVGRWIFWIYAVGSDGRVIPGEEVTQLISEEGANRD